MALKIGVFLLVCGAIPAVAGRSISVPPLYARSVHGSGPSATAYCLSADMSEPGTFLGGGVVKAVHAILVSVTNISNSTQTVTVTTRAGTSVRSSKSNGTPANTYTPQIVGPSTTMAADVSHTFSLAQGATFRHQVSLSCSDTACLIDAALGTSVAAGAGQTCIELESTVSFTINVAESSGAVVASITPAAHRSLGSQDKWYTTPEVIAVLGGQPF